MNVAGDTQQVGVRVDDDRLVTAPEERSIGAHEPVVPLRVYAIDTAHRPREIPQGRAHQQVVVIRHQAVGVHLQPEALRRFRKRLQKELVGLALRKAHLPATATVHHVVPRPFVLDP